MMLMYWYLFYNKKMKENTLLSRLFLCPGFYKNAIMQQHIKRGGRHERNVHFFHR